MDIGLFQEHLEKSIAEICLAEGSKKPEHLYAPVSYILSLGGKRVRPLLTLMACDLFGGDYHEATSAAIAIEVFHNFSLLHDDIMDNAPLRRGKPTVHEKWNIPIAILSGDAMLVRAYQFLDHYKGETGDKLRKLFSTTALQVCEGQQLDMDFETEHTVTQARYLQMISQKTAVLLGASMQMGAIVAKGSDVDATHVYEFGRQLGVAFQLQDDYLDLYGQHDSFGKKPGGDIIANKKTFMVIKAIEMANRYMKEELEQWMNHPTTDPDEKVNAVKNIFDFLKIPDHTQNKIQSHSEQALKHLKLIKAPKEKKQILEEFAENLMNRIK
ncbi:MAG: polyprenyl synthetase family protein [Bacteroidota bacterium]